jgi:phosphatidylglycerophosphatase C
MLSSCDLFPLTALKSDADSSEALPRFSVIFDLDGTLARRDTYLLFLFCCLKEFGLKRRPTSHLPFYVVFYCCGFITKARLKEAFLQSVLSGVSLERLRPIVEKYVAGLIKSGLNRRILKILQNHLNSGDRVILATASFDLYVERLAERLRVPNVVCTRAEVCLGVVTGRILGKNCRGPEKVQRLEALLAPEDWRNSILYTDHHSDLPLLQRVSQGVLVHPSFLTRLAFALQRIKFATYRNEMKSSSHARL